MNLDPTKERIPIRIQRQRTKGWRKPAFTINCCRPGRYGNPFKLVGDMVYGYAGHRRKLLPPWVYLCQGTERTVIDLHKDWILGAGKYDDLIIRRPFTLEQLKEELHRKNLMCFCPFTKECHTTYLLEIANS